MGRGQRPRGRLADGLSARWESARGSVETCPKPSENLVGSAARRHIKGPEPDWSCLVPREGGQQMPGRGTPPNNRLGPVCQSPVAAVTNYHTLSGRKQQKCIVL